MGTGTIATVFVILAAFMVTCLCVYVTYTNEYVDKMKSVYMCG